MMLDQGLLHIICCPVCAGTLSEVGNSLKCSGCAAWFDVVDGIPVFPFECEDREDLRLSQEKWARFWADYDWEGRRREYDESNLSHVLGHMGLGRPGERFLEIGGGPSFLAFELARRGLVAASVDLDLGVLRIAKEHFEKHGVKAWFVRANVNRLPFRADTFDTTAGLGVLEHTRRIEDSISELARVTKRGGSTFQTVPYLSLNTLVTASLRFGTVPHVPLLGPLIAALHIKLLHGKYMMYGYEESFTYRFLRQVFRRSGFRSARVGFYDYNQTLFKTRRILARLFFRIIRVKLMEWRPFADIAFVEAVR